MTLRRSFGTIVAIAGVGLAIVLVVGQRSLSHLGTAFTALIEERVRPAIDERVPKLNALAQAQALVLNADRDAYQALDGVKALRVEDAEADRAAQLQAIEENLAQTRARSEQAIAEAAGDLDALQVQTQQLLTDWEQAVAGYLAVQYENTAAMARRRQLFASLQEQFTPLRAELDRIGGALQADQSLPPEIRREAAEQIAQADRDLYQALVGLLDLYNLENGARTESLVVDLRENLAQVTTPALA